MRQATSFCLVLLLLWASAALAEAPLSEKTEACIACHATVHPGLVADWENSRHALVTPGEALKRPALERRISVEQAPAGLADVAVGCAECHTMNPKKHPDTFTHAGYEVHVVVTPADCAVCHPVEDGEYKGNIMSHAYGNLKNNPVYQNLMDTINGVQVFKDDAVTPAAPDALTEANSCLFCHGTVVKVGPLKVRETDLGEMEFPELGGWPNQGVGRINPDGTKGSCAACHTRHQFAMAMARQPATCAECHKGPDVPAYKVYKASKHGNLYDAVGNEWDFQTVPWQVGADFAAPTCAVCHASQLVGDEGDVLVERTHRMNDRLPWRIFGLIYSHAHPKSPDTTVIRNKAGLPLPTELTGEPAAEFLIGADEQAKRLGKMQQVCRACHASSWVQGHFERLEHTMATADKMVLAATRIMTRAWESGAARGLAQKDSLFNEALEKMWVEQWLFYANSTRFASAMAGADYGVFAEGRWHMSKNIQDMLERLREKSGKKN